MKLKSLLQETKVWERKFGESLPTLEDTTKAFKLKKEQDEKDKPDHFGGGENIKIFDYNTEHFDICRSAVILYNKLVEDVNDEGRIFTLDGTLNYVLGLLVERIENDKQIIHNLNLG